MTDLAPTARSANGELGRMAMTVADVAGPLGTAPVVHQSPYVKGRPGPFRVDVSSVAPELARDRAWLRDAAKRLAGAPGIASVAAVPPSIYVRPTYQFLRDHVVPAVLQAGDSYGLPAVPTQRTVAMKFSNPNANKALHVGHLRTNFLGMAISLLLEAQGWTVERLSVLSDWGIHICQAAVGYKHFGEGATPASVGVKGDHFVADCYVRFHQAEDRASLDEEATALLRRAHAGEPEAVALVRQVTEWCDEGISATYDRIGTRLAAAPRESEALATGERVLAQALQAGRVQRRADGSVFMSLGDADDGEVTLVRSDGTPVVYAQWLGVDVERHEARELDGDVVLFGDQWEAGASVYARLLTTLGLDWPQENITHGMVVTPAGAMSSRQGSGVRADDALNHFYHCFIELLRAEGRPVNTRLSDACEQLAVGFLKFALLRKPRKKAVEYDETGLWEQQRRSFCQIVKTVVDLETDSGSLGPSGRDAYDAASEVLFLVNLFPDIVTRCAIERDPAPLLRYLEDLSAGVAKCERLGGLDRPTQEAIRIVMQRGFRLLNIDLERAVAVLSAGGGTMQVPGDPESVSVTRRLIGLAPRPPAAELRARSVPLDRGTGETAASVIAAVSMESERLVRVAADPPRLAIPSATINAFGERCFEIDRALESEVVAILARHGGVRQILSEESGVIPLADSGCTVVLDPIDGTKNYKMGLSYYALAMAVLAEDGAVAGGLVLNLAAGTHYSAIRGRGAFRNGRRITAGAPAQLSAVDVIYVGLSKDAEELAALASIASRVSSFRAMGCAALDLCCLATGNVGLFVDLSNTAKTVDVLAASLIAEEAGALVTTAEGVPLLDGISRAADPVEAIYNWRFRTIGAANRELHEFAMAAGERAVGIRT